MTGDDTFQEVRGTLSAIEHANSAIDDLDFNMIAATSKKQSDCHFSLLSYLIYTALNIFCEGGALPASLSCSLRAASASSMR